MHQQAFYDLRLMCDITGRKPEDFEPLTFHVSVPPRIMLNSSGGQMNIPINLDIITLTGRRVDKKVQSINAVNRQISAVMAIITY